MWTGIVIRVPIPHTRDMNETTFTFQEAYGNMPRALWQEIKRHNVSPTDYMMIQFHAGEDWDRIRSFIKANLNGKSFNYPFGGTP